MFSPKDPQKELEQAGNQATQEAVQSMTASLFTLLETVRTLDKERTQNGEAKTNGATSQAKPIEITLGDEVVYQEDAHGAYANTLSLGEVDFLSNALKHSPGEKVSEEEPSASIMIGNRQVFALEKGVVTVNELQGEAQQRQNDLESLLTTQPALNGNNGNGLYPIPQAGGAVPVTIQEPLTFQVQRVREQPPSILERLENTSWLTAPAKREKWMKMPLTQRLSAAVAERFTTVRRQQVADVAIDLLQKYGNREGKQFVHQTEGYILKGQGNMVMVHDHEGRELLFLQTRAMGLPKVRGYYLTPQQEQDFLQVRQRIKQFGLSRFSKDPLIRSKQLGNLTPAGDLKLTEDLKGLAVVDVARRLLDVSGSVADRSGKRVLEGSQYRIEQSPQGLTIETKDRGEILSLNNGKLTSKLTSQDVRHFIFVAKELSRELKQIQSVSNTKIQQMQR
ncbi:MAG: hypothetical protein F6K47_04035 [Symploca sp. SIO2E6]|nr:hypothetical protein [Symploca sp. SIO2E6]